MPCSSWLKKGSESFGIEAGKGVTLTADEKVGCKVLAMSNAYNLLQRSVYFLSSSSYLVSVTDFSPDVLALEVDGLSFLAFFSGTTGVGEVTVPESLTAPITATVDGSTKYCFYWGLIPIF